MRHYEILASGCIPFFEAVEDMPLCVGPFFPRAPIAEAARVSRRTWDDMRRLAQDGEDLAVNHKPEDLQELERIGAVLLEYTRSFLTNEAMAIYFLQVVSGRPTVGFTNLPPRVPLQNTSRILFMNRDGEQTDGWCKTLDNVRDTLFIGLKNLGAFVVDVPRLDWLYE